MDEGLLKVDARRARDVQSTVAQGAAPKSALPAPGVRRDDCC
jgi:hypothetical protein